MRSSLRNLLIGSFGAVALGLMPLAAHVAHAQDSQEIDLNAHKIQIIHLPTASNSDTTTINITFTNFGDVGDCDGGDDDAITSGIEVGLSPLTCAEMICDGSPCLVAGPITVLPFDYVINPFVARTIGEVEYGTFLGLNPVGVGPGTVSARILLLSRPVDACGTWNLNLEATGLDLSSITSNPLSLLLNDTDGSGPFCFPIDDAIIGNKIIQPSSPVHRRGVRRSR